MPVMEFAPNRHRGVTTLMAVGADEPVPACSTSPLTKALLWIGGIYLVMKISGTSVRWVPKRRK